ncbi:Uncharacterized protein APZ42_028505 [Daphnia magna]|uniref:Uncharacterized protein n=1 Tax=Daphnia magna TaxID=35525 RepID=A0A164QG63_9CRUS|nr:Uncharacterized protein APZ42_028505 [Daphnia magna]
MEDQIQTLDARPDTDEGSVTHRPSAKNKKWQRLIVRIRRQVLAFIFFGEQTTSSLSL